MADVFKAVGNRIRVLRKNRGYSQERLAELAGIHHTYVGAVERGERNVTLETLKRIADGLEVGVQDLFPLPNTEGRNEIAELAAILQNADEEMVHMVSDFLKRLDRWSSAKRRRRSKKN